MRNPDRWVIDASVAAKWYLRDEDLLAQADQLRDSLVAATSTAPHIIRHEVANLLSAAVRTRRISRDYAGASLAHLLTSSLGAQLDPDSVIHHAMLVTVEHSIYIMDAVYIALAQQIGSEFVTADRKLFDAMTDRYPFVRWLGDVPVP